MVWDPPRQEVNVTRMMIYSLIPFLDIYAGWRIQKFWAIGGIQLIVASGLSFPITGFVPSPYGYIISFIPSIILGIFLTRLFARKYNEKIKSF